MVRSFDLNTSDGSRKSEGTLSEQICVLLLFGQPNDSSWSRAIFGSADQALAVENETVRMNVHVISSLTWFTHFASCQNKLIWLGWSGIGVEGWRSQGHSGVRRESRL